MALSDQSASVRLTPAERDRILWWLHKPVPPGRAKDLDVTIIRKIERAFDERCVCGNGEAEDDRGAVLRCPVHGPAFDEQER